MSPKRNEPMKELIAAKRSASMTKEGAWKKRRTRTPVVTRKVTKAAANADGQRGRLWLTQRVQYAESTFPEPGSRRLGASPVMPKPDAAAIRPVLQGKRCR